MRASRYAVALAGVLLAFLLPAAGAQPRLGTTFEILGTVLPPRPEPGAEVPRVPITLDPLFPLSVRVEKVLAGESPWTPGTELVFLIHSPAKLFSGETPEGARYRFRFAVFEGHFYAVSRVVRETPAAPRRRPVLRLSVIGAGGDPLTDPTVEVLLRVWGDFKRIRIPAAGNELAVPLDRAWLCDVAWPDACASEIHASIVISAPGYATLDSSGFEWALPAYSGNPPPKNLLWPAVVTFGTGPAVDIRQNRSLPVRVELRPLAERTLRLVDAQGVPVSGALVTASLFETNESHCGGIASETLSRSLSGADGVALIADGDFEYSIRIDKDHYYVRNPHDREKDVIPAKVFRGRLSQRETTLVLFDCPPRRLRLHVKAPKRPVAELYANGCMADCQGGVCSACCGPAGVADGEGSFVIEDFCPQEWTSLAIVDGKEKELWTVDPVSLGNEETVEIDLSRPQKRKP